MVLHLIIFTQKRTLFLWKLQNCTPTILAKNQWFILASCCYSSTHSWIWGITIMKYWNSVCTMGYLYICSSKIASCSCSSMIKQCNYGTTCCPWGGSTYKSILMFYSWQQKMRVECIIWLSPKINPCRYRKQVERWLLWSHLSFFSPIAQGSRFYARAINYSLRKHDVQFLLRQGQRY